jgi:hypothetical protein
MPVFELYKYVNYFREYDKWIGKLDLPEYLQILDIGGDYGSLFYYLKVKGFNIVNYEIYDYLVFKPVVINEFMVNDFINELFRFNFIKVDCEGCEYGIFKRISISKILDKNDRDVYAVALHKNGFYDERVYNEIREVCPYRIFVSDDGIEEIYTNKIKRGGIE